MNAPHFWQMVKCDDETKNKNAVRIMIQHRYSYGIKCLVNSKLLVLFATFSLVIMLVIIINGDRYTPIILFGAFKRN